jgi:hypothetical protein
MSYYTMSASKTLLILGGTGNIGRLAPQYALDQGKLFIGHYTALSYVYLGYKVTLLVRKAAKITPAPNLTVIEGSVLSESDLQRAVHASGGHVDAIISFLNPQRVTESPFAKFIGPERLMADSTSIAAKVLGDQPRQGEKPRLVVISAIGVGTSRAVTPLLMKAAINWTNVWKTYIDHDLVDKEIEGDCGDVVDWTLVLPTMLAEGSIKDVKTFEVTESGASFKTTKASVASFMIDVAAGKKGQEFSNKRVIISN